MSREGNYLAADRVVWNRADRRGPRRGQCRRRQSARRQIGQRQRRPDRHAARRDDRESAGRARKRRPHRGRSAATRAGDVTTLDNAVYSPCPVITRRRLPAQPELADHRRPGGPGSGAQPDPLRGRPAPAVRRHPAAAADLQRRHRRRWRGVSGLLIPDISIRQPQRARARAALLSAASRPTATSP